MDETTRALAIECPPIVALPVAGEELLFPVRRVY